MAKIHLAVFLGISLILVGALSDWATVDTGAAQIHVSGWDEDGWWVLVLGLLAAGAIVAGRPSVCLVCCLAAIGLIALANWQLPGALLSAHPGLDLPP